MFVTNKVVANMFVAWVAIGLTQGHVGQVRGATEMRPVLVIVGRPSSDG